MGGKMDTYVRHMSYDTNLLLIKYIFSWSFLHKLLVNSLDKILFKILMRMINDKLNKING